MAFQPNKALSQPPVGPGETGIVKTFSFTLAAGTATIPLGGFKLKNPLNAHVSVSDAFSVGGDDMNDRGEGDIPPAIELTESTLKLTRGHSTAGNNWVVQVTGEWIKI